MLKSFYILVIVSCCLFLISCRANKTEDFEETVVQGQPYYMLYQSTPYAWNYQYGRQGPISTDWAFYEEKLEQLGKSYEVRTDLLKTKIEGFQAENEKLKVENKRLEDEDKEFGKLSVATDEQHEIRANLLRDKIERLQIENQELKPELVQRKTWPDFWQELKAEDPDGKKLKSRIAKLEVRTDLLESKIEKLERENEQLRTESKEQREWSGFWKRLAKILMKERVTQWRK